MVGKPRDGGLHKGLGAEPMRRKGELFLMLLEASVANLPSRRADERCEDMNRVVTCAARSEHVHRVVACDAADL